jgi:hypothetical protein
MDLMERISLSNTRFTLLGTERYTVESVTWTEDNTAETNTATVTLKAGDGSFGGIASDAFTHNKAYSVTAVPTW